MPFVPWEPGPHGPDLTAVPSFILERIPGRPVRVRLIGECDIACAEALDTTLRDAERAAGRGLIVLDFSQVQLLSSSTARVLTAAEARFRATGGQTVVQHVPPSIDRFLRLTSLVDVFEIIDPG